MGASTFPLSDDVIALGDKIRGSPEIKIQQSCDTIVQPDLFNDSSVYDLENRDSGESHFRAVFAGSDPRMKSLNAGPVWVPPPSHCPTT